MWSTPSADGSEELIRLVYELLDAHDDTAQLAGQELEPSWAAHLEYLRRLQRLGRETIARATVVATR